MNRVLMFGLLAPIEGREGIRRQISLAHKYGTRCNTIEWARRGCMRKLESAEAFALRRIMDDAKKVYDEARKAMKRDRAKKRSKLESSSFLLERMKMTKAVFMEKKAMWKEARHRTFDVRAAQNLDVRANNLMKRVSARSKVAWGTKALHQSAMRQARAKMPLWDKHAQPNNPKPKRWDGSGALSVQIMGGMELADPWDEKMKSWKPAPKSPHMQLRLDPGVLVGKQLERAPRLAPGKSAKRFRVLRMRVSSNPDRSPVWGAWPIQMHRPLPEGARVMRATVQVLRRGEREVWTLLLFVETEVRGGLGRGDVGIDIGWRKIDEELRVGAWYDENGAHGDFRLTESEIESLKRAGHSRKPKQDSGEREEDRDESEEPANENEMAAGLRKVRDDNRNAMCAEILAWLRAHGSALPRWLEERTANISKWQSAGHLRKLWAVWQYCAVPGDEEIVASLEAYIIQDRHLRTYECEQRDQGIARRQDKYRRIANEIAKKYSRVMLEHFDLSKMARRPKDEDVESENETARSNRVIAALSKFRGAIVNAVLSRGGEVWKVPAAWTTQTCAESGKRERFDAAPEIDHTCECGCGLRWDQDVNAAKNILRLGREGKSDGENPDPSRGAERIEILREKQGKREGAWHRRKREKKEKAAETDAARSGGDMAAE